MVSLEKEKKEERSTEVGSKTLSKFGDKTQNGDILGTRFKSEKQRVRKDQLEKISEIALKHGRRSFADVLDLLLYCYEYLDKIRIKYHLPGLMATMDFIDKALPISDAELITREVISLLERLGINRDDYQVLEKGLISILFNVKLKKRKASEVLKPLFIMREE